MTASIYGRYDRLWLDSYGQASIAGLLRYASRFILPRFRIGTITETQSTANFSCNDANGALKISLLHESALEQRIHCKCGNSVGPVSLIHMEYRLVSTLT